MKSTAFLTFGQFYGRRDIGSSRIRCEWPVKYWDEAELFQMGADYETIIFQKAYWIEYAKRFKGKKILDICDADFLHWGYRIKQMIDLCHAVTVSSPALKEYIDKITDKPVVYIPDRIDFDEVSLNPKKHHGDTKIAAWFGYSENFPMLDSAIQSLADNGIEELIVIASRKSPYMLPAGLEGKVRLINYPWTRETVNADLQRADIVINPQLKTGRWKYKSNNKTVLAWALGLPVAHNNKELKEFLTAEARNEEGQKRAAEARRDYDVKQSVQQYKDLIASL